MCTFRRSCIGPWFACIGMIVGVEMCSAQVTREWIGPAGGAWLTSSHWDPNGNPDAVDTLLFGFGDHAVAAFGVEVNDGGTVFLTNGAVAEFGLLTIGSTSDGSMKLSEGATVTSAETHIGSSLSGTGVGTVSIMGASTSWMSSTLFSIGTLGHGDVTVGDSAMLTTPDLRLESGSLTIAGGASVSAGQMLSTAGTAPVSLTVDAGAMNVSGNFSFASSGAGTFLLTNGAQLTTGGGTFTRLATNSGGDVNASVSNGALWTNSSTEFTLGTANGSAAATLNIGAGGTLRSSQELHVFAGSTLGVHGGTVELAGLLIDGTLDFSDGIIDIQSGNFAHTVDLAIDGLNPVLKLSGSSIGVGDNIIIGDAQRGTLRINDTFLSSSTATIGKESGSVGTVEVTNGGWNAGLVLRIGLHGSGTLRLTQSQASAGDTFVGGAGGIGGAGLLIIEGNQAFFDNSGSIGIGSSQADGEVRVLDGGQLYVEDGIFVGQRGTLVLDGGRIEARQTFMGTSIDVAGSFKFRSGELLITSGSNQFANGIDIPDGGKLTIASEPSQTTIVAARVAGAAGSVIWAGENSELGDASRFDGFRTEGQIQVFPGATLTLHSKGFSQLGQLTTLITEFGQTATLVAPNGLAMSVGDNLEGAGVIDAPLTAASGTVINATGNLTLGSATAFDGFFSDGRIHTNDNIVTLLDANQAVLGSLTTLGNGSSPGTLTAANGALVEFGKNLSGHGAIDTPDDPAKPFINNGNVIGESLAEPLTLAGYVKGVGSFDNVVFTGTFSPGFSPAKVNLGSAVYDGTLHIEIGGTTPGSGHDRLNHILGASMAHLGGTLDVSLLGGFTPSAGDVFEIISAASITGTFADVVLPALADNLFWNIDYSANSVTLAVGAPGLLGDFNNDGIVDAADYVLWRKTGGTPETYDTWRANFGATAGSGAAANAADLSAVPEPASLMLLMVAGAMVVITRRR